MILIMKALFLPFVASTIPVLLFVINRSSWYKISQLLLLRLMLLAIRLWRKLNWREGCIIHWLGVTNIGGPQMERGVSRGFSGTAMTVWFGFGGGTTTVNRIAVTASHHIMTRSFVSLDMFSIWLVHKMATDYDSRLLILCLSYLCGFIKSMIWVKTSPPPSFVKSIKYNFSFYFK